MNGTSAPLRALLLDDGEALTHAGAALPHLPEALEVLARLEVAPAVPLDLGLLVATESPGGQGQPRIEALKRLGILRFFDAPEAHITSYSAAGLSRPALEGALRRLGLDPDVHAGLVVTASPAVVSACAAIGVRALRFGEGGDFDDWSAGPLTVMRVLGVREGESLLRALNLRLDARYGLQLARILRVETRGDGVTLVNGVAPTGGGSDGLGPLSVAVTLGPSGDVTTLETPESAEEAHAFVGMLQANSLVGPADGPLDPSMTHTLGTGSDGQPGVKRGRYSID